MGSIVAAARLLIILAAMLGTAAGAQAPSDPTTTKSQELRLNYLGSFGGMNIASERQGNIAAVAKGTCVEIYTCDDTSTPTLRSRFWIGAHIQTMVMIGQTLYLLPWSMPVRVLDLTDPSAPRELPAYHTEETGLDLLWRTMESSGTLLLIEEGFRRARPKLEVVDTTDPAHLRIVSSSGGISYGSERDTGETEDQDLQYDHEPSVIKSKMTISTPWRMIQRYLPLSSRLCVGLRTSQLTIIDTSNLAEPKILGHLSLPTADFLGDWSFHDTTLFLQREDGIALISLEDPANPRLLSKLKKKGPIAVDWPRALIAAQDEACTVYDLSDMTSPTAIAEIQLPKACDDLALRDHLLYVACQDLQILDLTDPSRPQLRGTLQGVSGERGDELGSFPACSIALLGQVAYCGDSVVDISDAENPVQIAEAVFSQKHDSDTPYLNYSVEVEGRWGVQTTREVNRDDVTVGYELLIYDLKDPRKPYVIKTVRGIQDDAMFCEGKLILSGPESGFVVLELEAGE